MDVALLDQYLVSGLMLGMIYALVAVGFTLFFGVMNIIQFAQGAIVMVGSFAALTVAVGLLAIGVDSNIVRFVAALIISIVVLGLLGVFIAEFVVLPLKDAPELNTLLITLMFGTVLRESVRLFYPDGADPHHFPALLPAGALGTDSYSVHIDTLLLFVLGLVAIVALHVVINKTKLGLAIRAVSQDEETAKTMGISFKTVVYITFAIACAMGALAGVIDGSYYGGIFFSDGLTLGVIGFAAAIVGGLGSVYGAIVGGFLFAFLQLFAVTVLPIDSGYKNVFAFAVIILIMAWRPRGLIVEARVDKV